MDDRRRDDPFKTYVEELRQTRSSGAAAREVSYYGHLAELLNAVGNTLRPKVRCVVNPRNQGAGMPDLGLYTTSQFQRNAPEPLEGQMPERGCVEVKGTGEELEAVAASAQVQRYLERYRQVLVTNYRDFALVGYDAEGKPTTLERYKLAASEAAFWSANPREMAAEHGERFIEYLKRVMLHAASLAAPEDVAWFLASYARDAKARIESRDLPALSNVRAALEQALGLRFEGEQGEHFFRSTLVQTLFYGVFSAWVLWSKQHAPADRAARFNWHDAAWSLHVPMIRALFYQVASPANLGSLGLVEVLDWTAAALNRVDRAAFFARFEEGHAVQYFYEPFLQAFDPQLRKDLGVWYTPTEIVKYMVARVDAVLREELGIADGLADKRVYVLDPCCGTGAYLVEVLRRIGETLAARGEDALAAEDLKLAAKERVFGFEILPAPFVVAHLQLGLLLQNLGAPLTEHTDERVGVYLTNALTGWEPPKEPKTHLLFPELEQERDAAERIKREERILVVLGNPPYNGYAGVAIGEERVLTDAYRTTTQAPPPQGQGLNNLYVRFFRMAERRIVEATGEGIVCFITQYSWLDGLSFTGMRERYLEAFDHIWIDSLNGDKYKTGKLTPDGQPDPSVFSTEFNREGIQVGTAIATLARSQKHRSAEVIHFREWWGKNKRAELLATVTENKGAPYTDVMPLLPLGLPFMPMHAEDEYGQWPLLPELFPVSFPGVKTSRDNFVVDIDRERLVRRIEQYFDPNISNEMMRRAAPVVMEDSARFRAEEVRNGLLRRGFLPQYVVRFLYRPMDIRWLYWEPETKLLDEKRSEYFPQVFDGNLFLFTTGRTRKSDIEPALFTRVLNDLNCMDSGARGFPLYLIDADEVLFRQGEADKPKPNLSVLAIEYLNDISADEQELFYHCLCILHSRSYRQEHNSALRQDWPRVPLPAEREALLESAALGRSVAALLDTERAVEGVTAGGVRPLLRTVGVVARTGGGGLRVAEGELEVTAGWGHAGKGGVTMPGKGKTVERDYSEAELAALEAEAAGLGLSAADVRARLGEKTLDVYLNDVAYWRNVPARVWDYTIGGYQVIKKWLSYREHELLKRPLTVDEAREVMNMARRIAALLLLEPALDANYEAVKRSTYTWPSAQT